MKVFPQSICDHVTGENTWFGVDMEEGFGPAYDKAMFAIESSDRFVDNDPERYDYFGDEQEIKFMWDMTEPEFKACMKPGKDWDGIDTSDYLGALFFGDFKLEFIWNDVAGVYNNLFIWGAEYAVNHAYGYLEDGTPYEEIDPPFVIPKRRTFDAFAKNVEEQIINWLNNNPTYIEYALISTNPTKWYPDGQCNVTRDITRIA